VPWSPTRSRPGSAPTSPLPCSPASGSTPCSAGGGRLGRRPGHAARHTVAGLGNPRRGPRTRGRGQPVKRRAGVWVAIGLLAALVMGGCGSDPPAARSASVADDPGLIHVHGLGNNPADGTLYAATHTGLFTVRDGAGHRVANHYQDTMGFTVVGPDHFLGSGHPDFRDTQLYQPGRRPLLGLIESRDAGRSWQPLSLLGEADFHALQVAHRERAALAQQGRRSELAAGREDQWPPRGLLGPQHDPVCGGGPARHRDLH
jgi:hypothetical protein